MPTHLCYIEYCLRVLSVSVARQGILSACQQHCILCTCELLTYCGRTFKKGEKAHAGDEREKEIERESISEREQVMMMPFFCSYRNKK